MAITLTENGKSSLDYLAKQINKNYPRLTIFNVAQEYNLSGDEINLLQEKVNQLKNK